MKVNKRKGLYYGILPKAFFIMLCANKKKKKTRVCLRVATRRL